MNALPLGSLSPTITQYKYAQQTETVDEFALCVSLAQAKEELPVYDELSDTIITRKIAGAQRAVEDFLNIDSTQRTRVSLWLIPKRIIELPYGVHQIVSVEQQLVRGGTFTPVTNYITHGIDFLSIQLEQQYPTKVTYLSGKAEVDDIFEEAVLQEVSYYFKNRNDPNETAPETINGLSVVTQNLLSNYRR